MLYPRKRCRILRKTGTLCKIEVGRFTYNLNTTYINIIYYTFSNLGKNDFGLGYTYYIGSIHARTNQNIYLNFRWAV